MNDRFKEIKVPELKKLVDKIHEDNSIVCIKKAEQVYNATLFLLKEERMINPQSRSYHIDIILAGAALHNCGATRYQIERDVTKLFKHRKVISKAVEELSSENIFIPETVVDGIYSVIEGQLGKSTPVAALIPSFGHSAFIPSIACALVYGGKWNND